MRTVRVISDEKKADWDAFVANRRAAISWHAYDWSRVLQRYYGLAFFPIVVYEGSEVRGILPLYRVQTLRSGTSLISIPYVVAGGIVADDEDADRLLLERAIQLSQEMGAVPITLKQYGRRIAGDLRTDEGFYNRELDLTPGTDHIWAGLGDINRARIDDTAGEPLELDYPSADVAGFYRALARHQHAWGVPQPSRRWIRLLIETQMYEVALLRCRGRIAAATLVKRFNGSASFPFTCLPSQSPDDIRFAYRMYWELILRLAAEGTRIFHSGRIPHNDSVPAYRLGWGGERHDYYYQYYGLRGKTESGSKRGRTRNLMGNVWKWMPQSVTGLVSPAIIREFPLIMAITKLVRKFLRNVDDCGLRGALRKGLAYLARPVYRHTTYRIYTIDIEHVQSQSRAAANDLQYLVVDQECGRVIESQIEGWAEWLRGEVRGRLAAGAVCLAALQGQTLAGFNLAAFNTVFIPLVNLRRTFRPGTAWSEHIAVRSEFRGQGVATELRLTLFEELRVRGVKKLYGGTLASNTAALALARKLGFRELADVTYTRVLVWKDWSYRRCRRRTPAQERTAHPITSAALASTP